MIYSIRKQLQLTILLVCLTGVTAAHCVVFTVGPGRRYTRIQEGIDAAIAIGGSNEVRVRSGIYRESVVIGPALASGRLEITGGWDELFLTRSEDPRQTVVDVAGTGRVLRVSPSGGTVWIVGFSFVGGFVEGRDSGAGAYAGPSGTAFAGMVNCRIWKNTLADGDWSEGSGVYASVGDEARFYLLRSSIVNNRGEISEGNATGGAVAVVARDRAVVVIDDCTIEQNELRGTADAARLDGTGAALGVHGDATIYLSRSRIADNTSRGDVLITANGGLYAYVTERGRAIIVDNEIAHNWVQSKAVSQSTGVQLSAPGRNGVIEFRRNAVLHNYDEDGRECQLVATARESSTIELSDSIIAGEARYGAQVLVFDTATANLTNLTVAEQGQFGIQATNRPGDSGTLTIYNSIIYRAEKPLLIKGVIDLGSNLIEAPDFVDPSNDNYRVNPGSSAIDAGDPSPPAGLTDYDIALNARESGARVDIGAYEQ